MRQTYLKENGLLSQEADMIKLKTASLMQRFIGTAVSYAAQPKNQNYGSFVPYLAKGFQQGMTQWLNTPFN